MSEQDQSSAAPAADSVAGTPNQGVWSALFAVRKEIQALARDAKNPRFGGYTSLKAVVEAVQPEFDAHDLVWSAKPRRNPDTGFLELAWTLRHVPSGEQVEDAMPLLLANEDMQAFGSAITYARRYALEAVLNLVSEDDDGNAASARSPSQVREQTAYGTPPADRKPSDKQLGYLRNLVTKARPSEAQIRVMLSKVGSGADPKGKWTLELNAEQASGLIEMFKDGLLPDPDHPSDIPAEQGEFQVGTDPDGTPF